MAKPKKPKLPKPAKKPLADFPPPIDDDQFTPVEPLVTEANLAKMGIPATAENIKKLMDIASSTYISDAADFQHVLETFYPTTLKVMKVKGSLEYPTGEAIPPKEKPAKDPGPKPVKKKAVPDKLTDDQLDELADLMGMPAPSKAKPKPLSQKPPVVVTEKGDSPYQVGQVVPYDEFTETALMLYKLGGTEPFGVFEGTKNGGFAVPTGADQDLIAQAQQNAVAKAKATPRPDDIKHQDKVEMIFQQLVNGVESQGPGEFLRRLQGQRSAGTLTNREASDLATRANSWASDLLRKKQKDSIVQYADFLTANGANPSTVQRVLSGQLDMSPRARAERALEMGLDPGMVWQRVDDPLKTRFQGRARAGLTYAGFNEALARAAAMTGEYSKRYPLIGSPKLLGLRAADTPLVPVTDRRQAIEMIWNQLPNAYDGTGRRVVRTNGMDLLFPSPDALHSYMMDQKLGDEGFKMGLHEEVSELMSHTKHAANVDALVRGNGPAVRRYLQTKADNIAVNNRGEAKGMITLPVTPQMLGNYGLRRTLAPPHFNDVEFGGFDEEPSGTADLKRTLDNRRKRAFRQYLRDAGLEGLLVEDEAGTSVAFDQPNRLRHAELAALDPNVADQPNIYNSVMPIMAAATAGQMGSQQQEQFQGFPPMEPNEGFGEYLIRTGQAQRATPYKRRAVDYRTAMGKMVGDFNTDISNQELEDWYVSLDEQASPEHEQFKQSLAATLDEPVFTGAPPDKDPDADGYVPMNFNTWFLNNITPLVWNKTGVDYDAADNMKEQVLAKLMGEPYDFYDPDIELYATMALDNLRDGQMADEFPAMSESEAAEAQQKYGDNARFYIGRDNQENFARRRAYALAQTFANGEHAPPGQGIAPAALATIGQTIFPHDGGNNYSNARLAVDALSGIRGRLRSANEWNQRASENPELAFDSVTGAKYATESGTNPSGLSNKMGKSDGYYQYAANALKSMWGNPSRTAEERDAIWQHERENNRTTPIVPDSVTQDPDQYDNRAEASKLFEDYKQGTDDWAAAMHSRLLGVPPTQFIKDAYDVPREIVSDPIELASTIASGGLGLLTKGLKSGLKSAAMGFIRGFPREGAEEVTENSGINSLLGDPYDYFFAPVTDNALTGDVDPRDANAYKSALEAGLLEQESKLKRATNLMRPK